MFVFQTMFAAVTETGTHQLTQAQHPIQCNFCKKKLRSFQAFQRHTLVHFNRHRCPVCSRMFTQLSSLQSHLRTHSGDKSHECPLCLRRFTQKSNMRSHLELHSVCNTFVCGKCAKSFKALRYLKQHEKRTCHKSSAESSPSQGRATDHVQPAPNPHQPSTSTLAQTSPSPDNAEHHIFGWAGLLGKQPSISAQTQTSPSRDNAEHQFILDLAGLMGQQRNTAVMAQPSPGPAHAQQYTGVAALQQQPNIPYYVQCDKCGHTMCM